ncbi:hypothetical protein [Agrobacterium vitis]|uniref:hypothetical protein n=1 Tax=Agrobacterium vitis TaxID=373 RepID=UPI00157436FC|nr:hypothetical protein [Agrobacterium vitis]NSZ19326.1 hypothetical protein [Agrobacterium vitis]QZO06194.1 hypothetical protein K4831_21335 [Agrobacterium vitis]UJL90517.1 hypothetical protein AVF2S5_21370 [Agrobacterium vitis]
MTNQLIEASTREMAEILGTHPRTLQHLEKQNWIDGKLGHDRWDVAKTTRYYLEHVKLAALTSKP